MNSTFLLTPKNVLTVSQLNRKIRTTLEKEFASIWVEGEISNFKHHTSGHMYFTLKDDQSQVSAVFFSRANQRVRFELKNGLQVLVMGKISLYEPRGQYQVYVEQVEPKGMGALQLAFLQLKEKLEKEGLFSIEHKKEIPKFPKCVGVVTSPTGAAIRDILNVVSRRFHGTSVLLRPVLVQGEGAAGDIVRGIEEMNAYGKLDVLIVGRGGGSLEDLWAFNEETVARAVFASKIPVISAVGHEIDWTICDLVADLRAPTPSAAAELVVQNREEIELRLRQSQARMRNAITGILNYWKQTLEAIIESHAFRQPKMLVQQYSQKLDEWMRQLQNYLKSFVSSKQHEFRTVIGRLHALSPLKILERGYSLTFDQEGELVNSVKKIKKGDLIKTQVTDGVIESKVGTVLKGTGLTS